MHHKNHNSPQHIKNNYPNSPAPQSVPKRSVLSRLRSRFQEKPATEAEVKQLGLDAKREVYKTMKAKAKAGRPSRFSGFGGGGSSGPSYRRSSKYAQQDNSGLFGGGNGGSWLMGPSEGPSLDFITGNDSRSRGRGRKQDSGFGKGLSDMFT